MNTAMSQTKPRNSLGLSVGTLSQQVARCIARVRALSNSPLEQYTYLDRIRCENYALFYEI
ncbi:hypothetical protein HDU99_009240, partial [Rhizoclosmatium hyalinum]